MILFHINFKCILYDIVLPNKYLSLSETVHWLRVCHGCFHMHGLTRPVRNANRELQNKQFLPTLGFEPGSSAYEANALSVEVFYLCLPMPLPNAGAQHTPLYSDLHQSESICCINCFLVDGGFRCDRTALDGSPKLCPVGFQMF